MEGKVYSMDEYRRVLRRAAADGVVLLRNEGGVLPLVSGSRLALFGRSQFCYYKSGTGSGGLVNTAYEVGIAEALEQDGRYRINSELREVYGKWLETHPFDTGAGWAQEPWFQEEMPLTEELVRRTREESDTAVIIIGRTAGEDKDNKATEGSYLLTEEEERMLETVCGIYERTVVLLNVGNIIDMKWVERYQPKAVLYVWQGGQEGGNGVLDVLVGEVNPSGRLSDTVAYDIADYPSTRNFGSMERNVYEEDIYVGYRYFSTFAPGKVLYPFGWGLSYTEFAVEVADCECGEGDPQGEVRLTVSVTNTGERPGRQVVYVFCEAPQGRLGKAARSLCAFRKTPLLAPGESIRLQIGIEKGELASYDDGGATGYKSCYVLEAGEYLFHVGENARDTVRAGGFVLRDTVVVKQLEEALAPVTAFSRLKPGEKRADGTWTEGSEEAPLRTADPMARRAERLPEEFAYTGDKGYRLPDVEAGRVSMGELLAQLTDEELCCLVRGEGMCSRKVTPGTAAAFGGVTERLEHYGFPLGCCADGPSGIRMDCGTIAVSLPSGTCLACTFDEELVEELFEWEGMELRKNRIDSLLGPGMNLRRNPLNGRNFEYFSEDPLVTGRMAAAQLRGMQKYGVTGTVKHFACNNQEYKRSFVESVVSERALREIYLKGFEIAVKEGQARSIMSTYGPVNGLWTAGNYDLLTTILRGEWGYRGIVMTDWWAKINDEGGEATVKNTAAMVRAQNDLYMVVADSLSNSNEDNSAEGLKTGAVTRGELQRSAANICRFLLQSPAYLRSRGVETELDRQLRAYAEQEENATGPILKVWVDENPGFVEPAQIPTDKGSKVTLEVTVKNPGYYRMELVCRASAETSELGQLSLSVFQDKQLVETVTMTGAEKEWTSRLVELPNEPFGHTFFIRLFFGMGGMELREVKLSQKES